MLNQRPIRVFRISTLFSVLAVLAISIVFFSGCSPNTITPEALNYAEGINPDLVLWYDEPATDRDQALPVGNGKLGAMVYGGIKSERIEISENTLYSDRMSLMGSGVAIGNFKKCVQMIVEAKYVLADRYVTKNLIHHKLPPHKVIGDLNIKFNGIGAADGYQRKLDLETGVTTTSFSHKGATYTREVFASKFDEVIVVRLTCDKEARLNFSAALGSDHSDAKMTTAANDRIILSGKASVIEFSPVDSSSPGMSGPGISGMLFETQLKVNATGGTVSSDKRGIHVQDADAVTLLISADTSYSGPEDADPDKPVNPSVLATMNVIQASAKSYNLLLKDHIADHRKRFGCISLHLSEPTKRSMLATDMRIKSASYFKDVVDGKASVGGGKNIDNAEIIKIAEKAVCENNSLAVLCFQFWRYLMLAGELDVAGLTELENCLTDILFKDDGEDIHILPALPAAWPNGKVKGLTTYGGFKADIEWADGKHVETIMRSKLGKACNICYGEHTIARQSNPGEVIRINGPLIITVIKNGKEVQKKVSHRFLKSGWQSGSVSIIDADGNVEWEFGTGDETTDSWYLGDGKVIFSHKNGVTLVGKDKEAIWTYDAPQGKENHSCHPIEDGKFLVGENGDGAWIVELNGDGTVAEKIKVSDHKDKRHAFRQVRKTPQGTYLATIMTENKTYEWDTDGKLVRTFPNGHYVAIRLKNGNTLTSGNPYKGGWHIAEFDTEGKVVWSLSDKDDIGLHVNMVCGMQRLENGNTVVANMLHGKNSDKEAPQIFEITPDKKVVWKVKNPKLNRIGSIQILDTEDGKIDNSKQQR